MKLILASQSAARKALLEKAGLTFECLPADLDERKLEEEHATKSPEDLAIVLAQEKAQHISSMYPDALVIGADQLLEFEGQIFSKAANIEDARNKLKAMRGRTHHLISAVSIAKNGEVLWSVSDKASLTMRDFDDAFLDNYIQQAGDALTKNVGAYALEGLGVQLFEDIKGDYFTILGMPLLALLKQLNERYGIGL